MLVQNADGKTKQDVLRTRQTMMEEMNRRQGEAVRRMGQRQVALQVASIRERLGWFLPFYASSAAFLYAGYRVTRSVVVLYPLVPMTFAFCYQLDLAYGNKTARIKGIAEEIMMKEAQLIHVPAWHYYNRPVQDEGTSSSVYKS
ncbi:plasminogen receptor (KT) [Procambarus clarkii]|uniref:plasminogen receptor (KT) n=1 Tax=Procambarus clarkii TaxID=6728 RepID=UPI00374422AF